MTYDFSQLNDKEFEILVNDLLSAHYGKKIERFKVGKDKGVDGRFFSNSDEEVIIQTKHYLKTGYSGLIRKLKKDELKNVVKLSPQKYILATSLGLSRDNKTQIQKIFNPYIKREDDIFGQEDLNDLLALYPKIEEKHFKLWITSTNVFDRIINNAIKGRSESQLIRLKNQSYRYIQTKNHREALEILNLKKILIISGEPGIGKTTLAENLCLHFASKDYEFIDIQESLSEAESVYKKGKKQVFYFDDFLGSNYFEAITNKKDSHIMRFIDRIQQDKNKRFILTTRTNILNSGVLHSSIFKNKKIRKKEYLLTIDTLTEFERAKILYNHIWFSKLPNEFIDELYKDKRYLEVINHKNFNPRLVEFITDVDRVLVDSSKYWVYILKTLNDPKDIWNDCFKRQNNPFVRNLVNLTVFNGGRIDEKDLRKSFSNIKKIEGIENTSHTEKDFDSMTRLATKSFLDRNSIYSEADYSLFNPSIADFVLNDYCKDLEKLVTIFKSLNTTGSLRQLSSLKAQNKISNDDSNSLINEIFYHSFQEQKSIDYRIIASSLVEMSRETETIIVLFLKQLIVTPPSISAFAEFIFLLETHIFKLDVVDFSFLAEIVSKSNLDEIDITELANFLERNNISDKPIIESLFVEVEKYLKKEIESTVLEQDLSDEINHIEIDYQKMESKISASIDFLVESFNSEIINDFIIDHKLIIDGVDIDDLAKDYLKMDQYDDDYDFRDTSYDYERDINDLFERS